MKPHAGGVLVGHAHQRLSEGLRGWLQASFDGVYMVADRTSLIEGAHRLQPVLVVVDLALAEGNVAALLAELQREAPHSPTLLLSDYNDARVDAAALAAGAAGVLHKSSLAADLSAAVEAVLAGRPFTSPPGPQ
ncbi:MAG TPA: response regulator [Burkholderiaceae bacterium]|nr:response regulator [Burkholderiaceae bacterium]